MEQEIKAQIYRLKRRADELEDRRKVPSHWSDGELEIFKNQLKFILSKIIELERKIK